MAREITLTCEALIIVIYLYYTQVNITCKRVTENNLIKGAGACYVNNCNGYESLTFFGVQKFITRAKTGALFHVIEKKTFKNYTLKQLKGLQGSHRCGNL